MGGANEASLRFGLSIFAKTIYLGDDGFKKAVLGELGALGGRVDLKPLVREYVAALSDVHTQLRALTDTCVAKWDATFDQALQQFKTAFPAEKSLIGLSAVQKGAEDKTAIGIFSDAIEYRKALQRKNRMLENLESRYVTGEVLKS